jgi:hypothetical protein
MFIISLLFNPDPFLVLQNTFGILILLSFSFVSTGAIFLLVFNCRQAMSSPPPPLWIQIRVVNK